jgi:uncharacterized membrane protein YqjE
MEEKKETKQSLLIKYIALVVLLFGIVSLGFVLYLILFVNVTNVL